MTVSNTLAMVALFASIGCAHTELTGDEHREAAAADMATAESYEPSQANLAEADRKMTSAFAHLNAARKLENFQDDACFGLPDPVRISCPLLAPHLARVEEVSGGVVLHFKSAQMTRTLGIQMQCHLAFAMANNFERTPCPLYLRGIAITLITDKAIGVQSGNPDIAGELKEAARRMFGEPHAAASGT